MSRLMRFLTSLLAVFAAGAALLLNTGAASASYDVQTTGYDISFPQCGGAYPHGAFGIVGVNGGYPFVHYNPCLADEVGQTPNPALYINTGYDPLYTQLDGRHTTFDCLVQSVAVGGTADQKAAWAVGCSEASRSIAYAASQGVAAPSSWWLDVETENSWSSTDLSLNQFTIQGVVDTILRQSPAAVGVYSTPVQWKQIVGNLPISGVLADWVATGISSARRAPRACADSFTGAPVWFVQYLRGGFDADYVC